MFTRAIVRKPGCSLVKGITTANLGLPIYEKAVEQHKRYINALKSLGLDVIVLEPNENYPDSCFVEDTAVVNEKVAIITHLGALSRQGEEIEIEQVLSMFFSYIERIQPPGTLEGGDVLRVNKKYFVGLSQRTNLEGAKQLKAILERFKFEVEIVPLVNFLHLKSGVNYIGENTLLIAGEFIENELFRSFSKIIVNPEENYAANSLLINNAILTPSGFLGVYKALKKIKKIIIILELSEFQKLDGGLSCLSIRF